MTIATCAPGAAFGTLGAYFGGPTSSTVSHLTKATAFTGLADSSQFLLSVWFEYPPDRNNYSIYPLNIATNSTFQIQVTSGQLHIYSITDANEGLQPVYSFTGEVSAGWHHLAGCAILDTAYRSRVFLDGTEVPQSGGYANSFPSPRNFGFLSMATGSPLPEVNPSQAKCSLAELYFAPGQYLDLTVPSNLAKFLNGKKPARLGSNGAVPTGTAPMLYLSGAGNGFAHNRGTGGDMTVAGASLVPSSLVMLG